MTQQIQKEARMDKLEEYCNGLQLRFLETCYYISFMLVTIY